MGKWKSISKNKWEKFVSYRGRPNQKRIIVQVKKYNANYIKDGYGFKLYNLREGLLRKSWEFIVTQEVTLINGDVIMSGVRYVNGISYETAFKKAKNYMRKN